jgi:Leucine-rich repeat (LRR) protein
LENLNVSNNQLTEVRGLEKLARLRTLDLGEFPSAQLSRTYHADNNKLESIGSASAMMTVRTLRINDNEIPSIDLSNFPKLRTLYADGNRIARLSRSGFETSRLENLSLRNQRCSQLRLSRSELSLVKRLYVSGKYMPFTRILGADWQVTHFLPISLPTRCRTCYTSKLLLALSQAFLPICLLSCRISKFSISITTISPRSRV